MEAPTSTGQNEGMRPYGISLTRSSIATSTALTMIHRRAASRFRFRLLIVSSIDPARNAGELTPKST